MTAKLKVCTTRTRHGYLFLCRPVTWEMAVCARSIHCVVVCTSSPSSRGTQTLAYNAPKDTKLQTWTAKIQSFFVRVIRFITIMMYAFFFIY